MYCNCVTWSGVSVITASDVLVASADTVTSRNKETTEPLLRFPFIHSLANPCNFALEIVSLTPFPVLHNLLVKEQSRFDSGEQLVLPAPLRYLTPSGEIPLAQQALDFLRPYRDVIDVQSTDPRYVNDKKREEGQFSLVEEFKLVISQVLLLVRHIYSPSVSLVLDLFS
jgi:hypothetical protein